MKMIKLMDSINFWDWSVYFFWPKVDDPSNKPTPKNQVQKLDPEIRLIRRKIPYSKISKAKKCPMLDDITFQQIFETVFEFKLFSCLRKRTAV